MKTQSQNLPQKDPLPKEKKELIDLIDQVKNRVTKFLKQNSEVIENYTFICPESEDKNKPSTSASFS